MCGDLISFGANNVFYDAMLFTPELYRLWNKIFYRRQEITLWQSNPQFITATIKPTAIHDDLRIPQTTLDC